MERIKEEVSNLSEFIKDIKGELYNTDTTSMNRKEEFTWVNGFIDRIWKEVRVELLKEVRSKIKKFKQWIKDTYFCIDLDRSEDIEKELIFFELNKLLKELEKP